MESKTALSPDGKYEVVVSEHYCKPEVRTILANSVDIRQSGTDPRRPRDTILQISGNYTIKTVWLDPTHLRVECPGCRQSMIQWKHETWEGISISYFFE